MVAPLVQRVRRMSIARWGLRARLRGMAFEEHPTRRTRRTPFHLTTSGSFPGPTLATVGGVIVSAIGDWCLSRPNAVPTLAGSCPLCVANRVVPRLDVKLREDG